MKTKYCIRCGKLIPASAKYCKYCGAQQVSNVTYQKQDINDINQSDVLPTHHPQKNSLNINWKIGIAAFIVLLILFLIPMLL